ncbi:hypothetical protein C8J57DRAFT_704116 [Mycena rebaudengoi]|nr:hypothetical protein C8J57DRAFT_704116 [Mycena rebaudengoi]
MPATYLPQSAGWLPTWTIIVAVTSVFNSVQNFATLKLTRRIYNNVPAETGTVSCLRVFMLTHNAASNTFTSPHICCVDPHRGDGSRLRCIPPGPKNHVRHGLFTYLIAFGHFSSELLIFRSATINPGVLSPVIVASTSLIWMFSQYNFYVKA